MGASFHLKQFQEIQKYQVLLKFESIKMVATFMLILTIEINPV